MSQLRKYNTFKHQIYFVDTVYNSKLVVLGMLWFYI